MAIQSSLSHPTPGPQALRLATPGRHYEHRANGKAHADAVPAPNPHSFAASLHTCGVIAW